MHFPCFSQRLALPNLLRARSLLAWFGKPYPKFLLSYSSFQRSYSMLVFMSGERCHSMPGQTQPTHHACALFFRLHSEGHRRFCNASSQHHFLSSVEFFYPKKFAFANSFLFSPIMTGFGTESLVPGPELETHFFFLEQDHFFSRDDRHLCLSGCCTATHSLKRASFPLLLTFISLYFFAHDCPQRTPESTALKKRVSKDSSTCFPAIFLSRAFRVLWTSLNRTVDSEQPPLCMLYEVLIKSPRT